MLLTTRAQQGHNGSWAQAPLLDSRVPSHCPAVGLSTEPATQSQQDGGLPGKVVSGDPACPGNDFEDPRECTPTQAMQGELLTPKCEIYVSVSFLAEPRSMQDPRPGIKPTTPAASVSATNYWTTREVPMLASPSQSSGSHPDVTPHPKGPPSPYAVSGWGRENDKPETREDSVWDFPGGPVAKTLHSQCRGPGFNPWLGNYMPHATTKTWQSQIKQINIFFKKEEDSASLYP